MAWLVFALAAALYANTLAHGFVLDDGMLILDNAFTKKGVAGWNVITPLETERATIELVNRGFVPERLRRPELRLSCLLWRK